MPEVSEERQDTSVRSPSRYMASWKSMRPFQMPGRQPDQSQDMDEIILRLWATLRLDMVLIAWS
jgi:hypothetical protein